MLHIHNAAFLIALWVFTC